MTSEGLGYMFEGDSADTCTIRFPLMSMGGPSGGPSIRRPRSEDPHRREWKFPYFYHFSYSCSARTSFATGSAWSCIVVQYQTVAVSAILDSHFHWFASNCITVQGLHYSPVSSNAVECF